jgi:hypothetical protein
MEEILVKYLERLLDAVIERLRNQSIEVKAFVIFLACISVAALANVSSFRLAPLCKTIKDFVAGCSVIVLAIDGLVLGIISIFTAFLLIRWLLTQFGRFDYDDSYFRYLAFVEWFISVLPLFTLEY